MKDIGRIIQSPSFDRQKALDQQIRLLELKRERLENLIELARKTKETGGKRTVDFTAFDTKKLDEYAARAKASWGMTREYEEYEQRSKGRTRSEDRELSSRLMQIFAQFGAVRNESPASDKAQALVGKLQAFITEHYYTCSDQVLSGLGQMYAGGGDMTDNIDRYGGEGTAVFVNEAIKVHCGR